MNKTIMILAIAVAFVAGMLVSAPQVFAPGQGQGDTLVASAIDQLTAAVQGISAVQGPQGEQGPQGDQGPPGTVDVYLETSIEKLLNGVNAQETEIFCEPGDVATGGGFRANGPGSYFNQNFPIGDSGWQVSIVRNDAVGEFFYTTFVKCIDLTP